MGFGKGVLAAGLLVWVWFDLVLVWEGPGDLRSAWKPPPPVCRVASESASPGGRRWEDALVDS